MRRTIIAGGLIAALCIPALAACSSDSDPGGASASPAVAGSAEASAVEGVPGTPEMRALCDQIVADGLSPDEATATVEGAGYTARVGTIDGEGQALTMDYREDRFTFDVEGGVVVSCTYG